MARSLVIVESPAKARTINRYLGKDYIVKSSIGHIRDLPMGGKASDPKARAKEAAKTRKLSVKAKETYRKQRARDQLVRRMGVDPEHNWQATYEILPGKEKVVDDARYRRVVFNEITRKAIQDAFANPTAIDVSRVSAQQARRFLDRVVGFELSPLLWAKVARGLSAGRVQSVAVRLIVEREREIRAFVPDEYWEAFADLRRAGDAEIYRFQVARDRGENYRPVSAAQSDEAMARLRGKAFKVESREDRPTTTRPSAPFITSTLQQAASTRLSFSVKKTMMMAQRLYEGGYITYMRTDSTNLSSDAIGAAREFIEKQFGAAYVPEQPNVYASKAAAQEAHEAIRPSNVTTASTSLVGMEADAVRLYELIWRQFVACQMPPAQYTSTTVIAQAGEFEARIRGRILRFDGFTRVLPAAPRKDEDRSLPDFVAGEVLDVALIEPRQHFTKPPPRFGEASLVRELEKRGIGRPSTYAAIISTIQDRGYVTLNARRFHAEKIGELVTDRLVENFDNLLDFGFTAQLELELDRIAEGAADWREVLNTFYGDFSGKLVRAQAELGGMRGNVPTDTNIPCAQCGRP
ncbi:MAG: type I DNA topoisomerase, partial [Proteobacteria bacterium]|nr:type I DNA topoisomerase [Pseudomonadota bacterium]